MTRTHDRRRHRGPSGLSAVLFAAWLGGCRCGAGGGSAELEIPSQPRTEIPELAAVRLAPGSVTIDGRLDDPGWARAQATGAFVAPGDGAGLPASPVNANARLAWDDTALYLAVQVYDADAVSPFGRDDIDPHVWAQASGIELMLQPGDFGDNRDYYEVQVDVNEAVWDTRFDDYNRPIEGDGEAQRFGHQDWSAQLERAVGREAAGGSYIVELALPWSALASDRTAVPPRPGDVWRANLYSFRDGQHHALAWSAILGEGNFHRSARFGRLRFAGE
jgi:hypothetical protein